MSLVADDTTNESARESHRFSLYSVGADRKESNVLLALILSSPDYFSANLCLLSFTSTLLQVLLEFTVHKKAHKVKPWS